MRFINGIAILDKNSSFPDPEFGWGDRPLAIGFDLNAELMLKAYARGIFPWSVNPVTWWSPDPRAIIELDGLHVSRSLAKTIRQNRFEIRCDTAFPDVVSGCSEFRSETNSTWITEEFIRAYRRLYLDGHAHSVECWQNGRLAGGVFGVAVGGLFAGESMFHRVTDASKVALYHLVERLKAGGFSLFDIQVISDHTERMGAFEIPRSEYLERLRKALKTPARWNSNPGTSE